MVWVVFDGMGGMVAIDGMGGFVAFAVDKVKFAFHRFKILVSMDALDMCTFFPFIVTMALLKTKLKKVKNEAFQVGVWRSFRSVRSVRSCFIIRI